MKKELWPVYKPLVQGQCRIKFEVFLKQNSFKVNKGSRIFQFVYENNDKILGVALLINNFEIGSSCLNWICVANKFQRQGIASEILKRIESHCLENDYMWLQLYSSFISENFWKSNGFILKMKKA
ncbi:GNAT family N-acetyltransferase [Spiroplasma sp. AdecLV25b]|uniref:GNAT family N-acetyltransferase n=1 Tax=Spiroplasma sp. AdecLV25b TaxID=3027162 RepID=UPI0027E20D50|nr:GNAT family N-acetyltransferase [Spiroplasma sp. AdecLV25b]